MKRVLATLLVSAMVCTTGFAAQASIEPFRAEYATLRNGSEVGRTTLDLSDNGDGSWTLRSETNGTTGLALLAGIHVIETSRFRWHGSQPEALTYDYRQEGALKQRTRHADFDWKQGEVQVHEGGEDFRYATAAGLIDRQSVTLALAAGLMRGTTTFQYKVAVKDRIEDMRYEREGIETITVPAGRFEAVLMRREGAAGADRKRVARSWFAESLGWIPVQIEQTSKNGDTITLQLMSLRRP